MKGKRHQPKSKQYSEIEVIEILSDSEVPPPPRKKIKINQNPSIQTNKMASNPYSIIPQIPTYELTDLQMQGDPVKLLTKLEKQFQQYGAIKLKASKNWNPPFNFRFTQKPITTRFQSLHKLKTGKSFSENQGAYTINTFQAMAQNFQKEYKYKTNPNGQTIEEKKEMEFWNLVNSDRALTDPQYKVRIQYAADLPVNKFGSGFPLTQSRKTTDEYFSYHNNLFNLNNIYQSPSSILRIAKQQNQFISGVTTPWVYMGMMFSTFCWHVEDLWLNSLNYNHKGGIKTWYIIPGKDKEKFDAYVCKKTQKDDLLDKITFMLDPLEVMKAGIRVYKVYQRPKQYICTFFKAYHCGFSQSYNVGEAVNFISPLSLKTIKQAIAHYHKQKNHKPLVFPYQWLILKNCEQNRQQLGYNQIFQKQYKQMVTKELKELSSISKSILISNVQEYPSTTKYDKNSCSSCHEYQYLRSLKCKKCGKNFCINHVSECCGVGFTLMVRQIKGPRSKIWDVFNITSKHK